jgi:hypothetical protein
MQQRLDEFVIKSASERLKVIVKSGRWVVLAVSFAAMLFALFAFWRQVQSVRGYERGYSAGLVQTAVDRALPSLEIAIAELGKQDTDKAVAIKNIEEATRVLTWLHSAILRRDTHSTLEPEWKLGFIASAYAESQPAAATLPSGAKQWLLGGVLGVLAIVFIGSVVTIFMTKDAEVLRFAFDTVKTLMGFFIGVATTLMGST